METKDASKKGEATRNERRARELRANLLKRKALAKDRAQRAGSRQDTSANEAES